MAAVQPTASSHQNSLTARWQEAQSRCHENLRDTEQRHVLAFQTPKQLEDDLRRLEKEQSDTYVQKMIDQLYPCLTAIDSIFFLLVAVSPPVTIEGAMFWGILHLVITSAISSSSSLGKLVTMLNKIRAEMSFFAECAQSVSNNQELQNSIVDSLIVLMEFWVETEKLFRQGPQERLLIEGWPGLTSSFEVTMNKLNTSVESVHRHALLGLAGTVNLQVQRNTNILSMLTFGEEDERVFPCYSLPDKLPYFFRREKEMSGISEHLEKPLDPDELRTFVLYGLGGSGKTSAARAYAQQCKSTGVYDAVFWIRGQTIADVRDSFVGIAHELGLPIEEGTKDSESIMLKVRTWLSKTKKKWLLIYDNVEDPKVLHKSLPSGSGRLLVTTRYKWLGFRARLTTKGNRIQELPTFSDEESLEIFVGLCEVFEPGRDRKSEYRLIKNFLVELGGLALGIEQIAAYVSYCGESIDSFIQQYKRASKRIHESNLGSVAEQTLATVWEVQFTEIRDTFAAKLLGVLCFLAPDSIPISMFTPQDEWDEEILDAVHFSEDETFKALETLMRVGLIKRSNTIVTVHRLVQKSFLEMNFGSKPSELQPLFDCACTLTNHQFPKSDTGYGHFGRWDACAKYLPHVISLAHFYERQARVRNKLSMSPDLTRVLRNSAWYQYECGNPKECLELIDIAKHGCTVQESLDNAYLCSHGACAYYDLHEVSKGKELIETAVKTREKLLDANNGQMANTYNNKALLEASACNYDEALRLFRKALEIRRVLKDNYLAGTHLMLGMTLVLKGDLDLAREEFIACETRCKEAGLNMDLFLHTLCFWRGNMDLELGNIEAAKAHFQEGRTTVTRLSPTYISAAAFEYKLGVVELKLNNIDSAIHHLNQSIDIAVYREIESEQARSYRMKAIALDLKQNRTESEKFEAIEAKRTSQNMLETFFRNQTWVNDQGLSEAQKYDIMVCAERR